MCASPTLRKKMLCLMVTACTLYHCNSTDVRVITPQLARIPSSLTCQRQLW